MSLFSRGALCVPLDDQENIICTLPSHIATRTVVAIFEGRVLYRAPVTVVAICEGKLCSSTLQRHGSCFSLENKRDYEYCSMARTLIL